MLAEDLYPSVLPVVAGPHLDLPRAQAAHPLGDIAARAPLDLPDRRLPQDLKLRPELAQQVVILLLHPHAAAAKAGGGRDHLGQRHQALEGLGHGGTVPLGPVRQLLDPVEHPHRDPAAADRAAPALLAGFGRAQACLLYTSRCVEETVLAYLSSRGPRSSRYPLAT